MTDAAGLPDIAAVTALIRAVAAAEIMPRFNNLAAHEVSNKASGEIVTAADIAAEHRLEADLTALMPGAGVIGEEGAATDAGVFAAFDGGGPVWIIDPLDGTRNFAKGSECFAVIVAYCLGTRVLAGWIHAPVGNITAIAVAGEGAWLESGDGAGKDPLRVAPGRAIAEMTGSIGKRRGKNLGQRALDAGAEFPAKTIRYGCVGHEYIDLARGRLDFAEYGNLKPWDHAAGVLIHAEAGGVAMLVDDEAPYRPGAPEPRRLLAAPDAESWQQLKRAFAD